MKTGILALLLVFFVQSGSAQIAVSYFPFQSILAISSNTEKRVWADYKLETNSFSSNLNMEFSPKINLKRSEWVNYYLGPGISINPANNEANSSLVNGSFLDIGARIKPWARFRNFQVVFEVSPYVNRLFSNGNIRTRLGAAWNFSKKKKGDE